MIPLARKSQSLQARILSGSLVLLSGSSLANLINFGYNIALARFLGPTGFGHATAVYTLLTLISAVTLSFQFVSAKLVAQQTSEAGREAAYRAFHRGALACGVLVAVLLILFQQQIRDYLNLPSASLVVLIAIAAAFYVPLGSRRGFIQGAYGFRSLAKNLVLEGTVRLGASVLMVVLGFGVTGVIVANVAAVAVAYLVLAPKLEAPGPSPIRLRSAARETFQGMVFFSGQVLINNCDIVLVKHFFAPKEAGVYAAIAMVGRVIFALSSAVVNSMFPVVAGTRSEDRKNHSLIATSLLLVLGIGAVAAVALRFTPAWIWPRLFGPGFELPGAHGLPILLTLYAISTVIYSLSVVLITYEMAYKIANTSWLQLVFSGAVIATICWFHASLQQVILIQLGLMIFLLTVVGVPFLRNASRSATPEADKSATSIRLIRRISEDQVIAEFLKSDFANAAYSKYHQSLQSIVLNPDLDSPDEVAKRRALLFLRHRSLWKELPAGTEWFEVEVNESQLQQIWVFPRAQWRRIARGNFAVPEVVERMRRTGANDDAFMAKIETIRDGLFKRDSAPGSIVLIGLDETQPMTILDGNHRLVAAVLEGRVDKLRFVCGLSPKMTRCCWYRTNLLTLTRYTRNLVRHRARHPENELESLFEPLA